MTDASPLSPAGPSIDSAKYRQVLGHYPTGVTVVTAIDEGAPVGMAVGSFTSLSLDPALVLFSPGKRSSSWPRIERAGSFCVNVLGEEQELVCRAFAAKADDKFASIGWRPAPVTGAPIIEGILAWIECEIERIDEGGDHWIVLGRVLDLDVAHEHGPLVFFRGGYGRYVP